MFHNLCVMLCSCFHTSVLFFFNDNKDNSRSIKGLIDCVVTRYDECRFKRMHQTGKQVILTDLLGSPTDQDRMFIIKNIPTFIALATMSPFSIRKKTVIRVSAKCIVDIKINCTIFHIFIIWKRE